MTPERLQNDAAVVVDLRNAGVEADDLVAGRQRGRQVLLVHERVGEHQQRFDVVRLDGDGLLGVLACRLVLLPQDHRQIGEDRAVRWRVFQCIAQPLFRVLEVRRIHQFQGFKEQSARVVFAHSKSQFLA